MDSEVKQLMVNELKEELQDRGLDTHGLRADLVDRLKAALEAEADVQHTEAGVQKADYEEDSRVERDERALTEGCEEEDGSAVHHSVPDFSVHVNVIKIEPVEEQEAEPEMETQPVCKEEEEEQPVNVKREDEQQTSEVAGRWAEMWSQQATQSTSTHAGHKRRYDESQSNSYYKHQEDKRFRSVQLPEEEEEEEEEDFDDTLVAIDRYNCDLHFKVSRSRYSGYPLSLEGFTYLWSGARATYGVSSGRVCYELKITEVISVKDLPLTEPDVVRVGWSLDSCSSQLGEEAFSYGYGGTGKKSSDCRFTDYGEKFGENDVIGCYADFEISEEVEIAFSKNGKWLDVAYRVCKGELAGRALFPHVLVKNCAVEFNFGQKGEPYYSSPEGYTFIQAVRAEDRTRGTVGPENKADCEILMKTAWASRQAQMIPEKKYNMLGTSAIMDKVKHLHPAVVWPKPSTEIKEEHLDASEHDFPQWDMEKHMLTAQLKEKKTEIEALKVQLEEKEAECQWLKEEVYRLWEIVESKPDVSSLPPRLNVPVTDDQEEPSPSSSETSKEFPPAGLPLDLGFPASFFMERCWSGNASILPDVALREISAVNEKILYRMSKNRPDRYGALVFRSIISQELYEQWVMNTNWDGTRGKWGVPHNVRDFVTRRVRERFPDMSSADKKAVKERVNECLRMRRKTIVPIPYSSK